MLSFCLHPLRRAVAFLFIGMPFFFFGSNVDDVHAQSNVGIGTTTPAASAVLDLTSTTQGLLVPRMSNYVAGISSPANGLLVYDNVKNTFYYYNNTAWVPFLSSGSGWGLLGNGGTVAGTNFLGTTDPIDFRIRTSNLERVAVTAAGLVGVGTNAPASKLTVLDGNQALGTTANQSILTSDAEGINIGGSLGLGGNRTAASPTPFAQISGRKENATSGGNEGYLQFATLNGSNVMLEGMRVNSSQDVSIGSAQSASAATSAAKLSITQTATSTQKALLVTQNGAALFGNTQYATYSVATGAGSYNVAGYFSATNAQTGNYGLLVANGNVGVGTITPTQKVEIAGNTKLDASGGVASQLQFQNPAGTFNTTFAAGAQTAAIAYVLPTAQGASSTYLQNDGAGNLSWATVSSPPLASLWTVGAGTSSLVGHGLNNYASGNYAIVAGQNDSATGLNSVAIGGYQNISGGNYSVVSGGQSNVTTGINNTISGGINNYTAGNYATVGGGQNDSATSFNATVSGGWNNAATNQYACVGGGQLNKASGVGSAIGGGYTNHAKNQFSTIAGGSGNTTSGDYSFIGGGQNATASAMYTVVGGGLTSLASGNYASVLGGQLNTATGPYSSVLGGLSNLVTSLGSYSTVLGGQSDTVSGSWSLAFGNGANVSQDATVVFNHPSSSTNTRVGIRTNSPSQALEVKNGNVLLSNSGTADTLIFSDPNSGVYSSFVARAQTKSDGTSASIQYTLPDTLANDDAELVQDYGTGKMRWRADHHYNINTTTVSGTTNALAVPATGTFFLISGSATPIINGITANASMDGRMIILCNTGATAITITNGSGTGTAKIQRYSGAGNLSLVQYMTMTIVYDATNGVWHCLS